MKAGRAFNPKIQKISYIYKYKYQLLKSWYLLLFFRFNYYISKTPIPLEKVGWGISVYLWLNFRKFCPTRPEPTVTGRRERAEALKYRAIYKAFALTGRLKDCHYTQGDALGGHWKRYPILSCIACFWTLILVQEAFHLLKVEYFFGQEYSPK